MNRLKINEAKAGMRKTKMSTTVGSPSKLQMVLLEARLDGWAGLAVAGVVNNRQWAFNKKTNVVS